MNRRRNKEVIKEEILRLNKEIKEKIRTDDKEIRKVNEEIKVHKEIRINNKIIEEMK